MIEAGFLSEVGYGGDVVWGNWLHSTRMGTASPTARSSRTPKVRGGSATPKPGDPDAVTHPGDPDHPPARATAVEAASWGIVKRFLKFLYR